MKKRNSNRKLYILNGKLVEDIPKNSRVIAFEELNELFKKKLAGLPTPGWKITIINEGII